MAEVIFNESGFVFDFTQCVCVEKADAQNVAGTKSVDFIAETEKCSLYIEVKNPDNPRAIGHPEREKFYQDIQSNQTKFPLEIGMKVKDSLLQQYALGKIFTKPIHFILILQASNLAAKERIRLFEKIRGYVPTGLNCNDFQNFTSIIFHLQTITEFQEKYDQFITITEDHIN
jgi:hypothetical protein